MKHSRSHLAFGLLIAVFVLARWHIFQLDQDRVITDTHGYVRVAGQDLASTEFWAGERPFTVPLVYRLFGLTSEADLVPAKTIRVTSFQLGLSLVSWGLLATAVAATLNQHWQRVTAFAFILAFACTLDIAQWDRILLSESIASSLFALLLAGWVAGISIWGGTGLAPNSAGVAVYLSIMTVGAVLFSFSRDANAYLLGMGSIVLAVSLVIQKSWDTKMRQVLAGLAVVMAAIFVVHESTIRAGQRWLGPFLNVFSARILPVDEFVNFFAARGMPADAITEEMYLGRPVFLGQLQNTEDGRRLMDWVEANGRSTYLEFLLWRPVQNLGKPLQRAGRMLSPDSSEYRLALRADPIWLQAISAALFPSRSVLVGLAVLASGIGLDRWGTPDRQAGMIIPAIGLLILAYPLMFLFWHADEIELERHSYQLALQIRLAAWLLLLSALPLIGRLRRRDIARLAQSRRKGNQTDDLD